MDYTVGMKIKVNSTSNPFMRIDGREGEILYVDDYGKLYGTWGSAAINPRVDDIEVIYNPIESPLYYATPCQVRWYNWKTGFFDGGIAYKDILISGIDGEVYTLNYIIGKARDCGMRASDAIIELEWINISESIWEEY